VEIKEPVIEEKNSFNFFTSIWLVPIVALIIGGWLVYEHFSKLGPEIKIEFKNSGGLQAGVSEVKFRDVPVGKVTKIEINSKKDGVIVYARINKDAEPFLNKSTKFWIVKPQVDYSGVKGLETILSGSYIKMYAKKGGKLKKSFIGLNRDYTDINNVTFYTLRANFPIKVKKATPIFFKGVEVGNVDSVNLDLKTKDLIIKIKIKNKYTSLINESTKFWLQSLVNLKLNDNRLDVNMAPLPTLLLGGIEFDTQFNKEYKSAKDKIFNLYKSEYEAKLNKLKFSKPIIKKVLLKYSGDVSSLDIGVPIKYKGFRVGSIERISIEYDKKNKNYKALCFGELDLSNFNSKKGDGFENFKELIKEGLIARLENSNPILNKTVINLVFDKNSSNKKLIYSTNFNAYILPTKNYKNSDALAQISQIIDKLNKLNLKNSVENINELLKESKILVTKTTKVIKNIDAIISNKDFKNIGKNLNKSLKALTSTLNTTKKTLQGYSNNSLFGDKIDALLNELHQTTKQTEKLINKLNKKPNSLIFGD